MSDEPKGTPAPEAKPPVADPRPPAPEPKGAAAPPAPDSGDPSKLPEWATKRIEQAQRVAEKRVLDALGVTSADDAAAALKRLKELEDAQLTEAERTKKAIDELTPKAQRADELEVKYAALVNAQFDALSESVRAAIDEVAGGKAEKRMEIMTVMRAAGQLMPPAAPAPANTGPKGAPPPPAPGGASTKFAEYSAITNPVQRTLFYRNNAAQIEASRPA